MMPDFNDQLKKINKRAYAEVQRDFSRLAKTVGKLDPIKLLSQLTLTFLLVPVNEFIDESSNTAEWARYIEFLAGYLLSKKYPQKTKMNVDGKDIEHVEKQLEKYIQSIATYLTTSPPSRESEKDLETVIASAKIHSLFVRGESYPHLLRQTAQSIYAQHNDWFVKRLGFTIDDALTISNSIIDEYNRRVNDEKQSCLERARIYVDELISKGQGSEEKRQELETMVGIYYYFGNSDAILSFTLDDLVRFSGMPKEVCESFLKRLSQTFGYKNPLFPNAFSDPYTAPWDFNTLYERPIILHEDKYLLPVPSLFSEVLLQTFYYDLIADDGYWRGPGEKKYGAWLEQKTAECLKRIFPESEVYLNPQYPNRNELCDVLVLHDRKVIIVQCKTKKLNFNSRVGKDIASIKSDLTKGVKASFDQAIRARDYLLSNPSPKIIVAQGELEIDSGQISEIFPMSVTLEGYQNLTTRLANINPVLKLFADNQYPWAISLFDLSIVTELIETPAMFFHYAQRRLAVEKTNFRLMADEIDLLGFYFDQGLFFETDEFAEINGAAFTGFSEDIDRYMFEKYVCGMNPQKPQQQMPAKFSEYLQTIENMESSYKTDCAIRLLDLGSEGREHFVNAVERAKESTVNDGGIHSFSTVLKNSSFGIAFVAMDAQGDLEKLFKQTFTFSALKKYATRCKEWVGFGWDKNSKNLLDVAVFISFDWYEDPEIAKLAKKSLKPGEKMNLG
jgi:hypothetical protein